LDTPKVLALCWTILIKNEHVSAADRKATILKIDELLGLELGKAVSVSELPPEVIQLAAERTTAKTNKDFKKSDELRDKIKALGYEVKDTPEGQKISR
jgi:cysteinyl-tRNA synthetase